MNSQKIITYLHLSQLRNKEKFQQGDFEWKIGNGVAFESAYVTQLKKKETKNFKNHHYDSKCPKII